MYLDRLSLSHFRNYEYQQVTFDKTLNIIHGDNAQGKTNLLEAIHLLTTLQPFKTSNYRELILWNQPQAIIEGAFVNENIGKRYSLCLDHQRKRPGINGKQIWKPEDYLGQTYSICFLPQDLYLLQGTPRQRRRYLDKVIYGFYPHYGAVLSRYYKALLQRNAALQMGKDDLIALWGEQLCENGAKIHLNRLLFIEKLNTLTSCLYRKISGSDDQEMVLKYETEIDLDMNLEKENLSSIVVFLLQTKLKKREADEKRLRRSLVGPHRDDIAVHIGKRDLRHFGSQGEQRTAVLSIKLAELSLFESEMDKKPIFLLDDITSELDHHRMKYLFSVLREKKRQIFVTTTNPSLFLN